MKKIYIISIILMLSMSAFAQSTVTALTYTISVPTEDTQMFIENESYLGVSFDAKSYLTEWLSVGGYVGWHVMYGQTDKVIEIEQGHVSGNQFRYINSFPLMLNSHVYLGGVDCFRPYFYISCRSQEVIRALLCHPWQSKTPGKYPVCQKGQQDLTLCPLLSIHTC